jgi:hypothetical protein
MDESFQEYETGRLRRMTVEQKLRTLDALRRSAWLLVEAGTRIRHPDFTSAQIRAEARRVMIDDPS